MRLIAEFALLLCTEATRRVGMEAGLQRFAIRESIPIMT